ncbi:hypothetical protein I4U23_010513 [Adineta vaga]|nr:hypothetical protein I4U23_010513 [Adineta vaga]
MTYRSTLPQWYINPLLNHGTNVCRSCGSQSFVDIRIPICVRCDGIIADCPYYARYEHLCADCSRQRTVCRCDYPSSTDLFESPSSESLNYSSCSCYNDVRNCCCCCLYRSPSYRNYSCCSYYCSECG